MVGARGPSGTTMELSKCVCVQPQIKHSSRSTCKTKASRGSAESGKIVGKLDPADVCESCLMGVSGATSYSSEFGDPRERVFFAHRPHPLNSSLASYVAPLSNMTAQTEFSKKRRPRQSFCLEAERSFCEVCTSFFKWATKIWQLALVEILRRWAGRRGPGGESNLSSNNL